jgi:hypothetical protein
MEEGGDQIRGWDRRHLSPVVGSRRPPRTLPLGHPRDGAALHFAVEVLGAALPVVRSRAYQHGLDQLGAAFA